MSENMTQFTMRISNDVYEKVKVSAEKNKRSIAKEIEYILECWCNTSETDISQSAKELYLALQKNKIMF